MCKSFLFLLLFVSISCNGQTTPFDKVVGGPCEGCEAIFEFENKNLTAIDTLPLFFENEPKLKITGRIFEKDGKTPVSDVLIYIYQTNREGIYQTKGDEVGWGKRHGFIRGWVKTDSGGNYTFYTFRPAAYPSRDEPEHIHLTVKEPGKTAYYMDEYVFVDEPFLREEKRKNLPNRGGSGIVKPTIENGILTVHRDLVLGKNIPDYD